jgi:hypothetical protein
MVRSLAHRTATEPAGLGGNPPSGKSEFGLLNVEMRDSIDWVKNDRAQRFSPSKFSGSLFNAEP